MNTSDTCPCRTCTLRWSTSTSSFLAEGADCEAEGVAFAPAPAPPAPAAVPTPAPAPTPLLEDVDRAAPEAARPSGLTADVALEAAEADAPRDGVARLRATLAEAGAVAGQAQRQESGCVAPPHKPTHPFLRHRLFVGKCGAQLVKKVQHTRSLSRSVVAPRGEDTKRNGVGACTYLLKVRLDLHILKPFLKERN